MSFEGAWLVKGRENDLSAGNNVVPYGRKFIYQIVYVNMLDRIKRPHDFDDINVPEKIQV